jgi:hypothetical protein
MHRGVINVRRFDARLFVGAGDCSLKCLNCIVDVASVVGTSMHTACLAVTLAPERIGMRRLERPNPT